MRLNLICGLLAATLASAANAGVVLDERATTPAAAPAIVAPMTPMAAPVAVAMATPSARGSVTGYVANPGWSKKAPDAESMKGVSPGLADNYVAFGDAIFRLLPEGHPSVVLDGTREAISMPVTWKAGSSRSEALDQIATNFGLNVVFTGSKPGSHLMVSKAASPSPMSATVATAAPAQVFRPAASVATPAVAAVAASPVPQGPVMHGYEVRLTDIRLSTAMVRWATEGGVRIRWDADKHVLISAPQTFTAASVLDAVAMALATPGIRNSEFPLEACEYPNTPRLIRITRQGEQAKDCPQ